MEEWRAITGFEGIYEVSSFGRVKSLERYTHRTGGGFRHLKEKILIGWTQDRGYKQVVLTKDKRHKNFYVHRLVAEAFIPNPTNLPEINHKDECKDNNLATNLEWCSREYNNFYGTRVERAAKKCRKRVAQYTKDGRLVAVFPSLKEAARQNGFDYSSLSNCYVGRHKTSYGYIWRPA